MDKPKLKYPKRNNAVDAIKIKTPLLFMLILPVAL
jgi:hypothetical protein